MNLEAVKEVIDRLSAEELHQLQQYIAQRSAALSTVQSLSTLSTEERIRRLDAAAQAVRQGFSESQWAELEEAMNEEL